MRTTTYGFQVPQSGDKGDTIFPAMEANIDQLDSHSHNGSDSSKLDRKAVNSIVQSIVSADWVDQGGGLYRQLVTVPSGLLFDNVCIETRLSTGEKVALGVEKVSTTTFYLYINDNSQDVKVLYG